MSIADNLTQSEDLPEDLQFLMNELGAAARAAALILTNVTAAAKNTALRAAAKALRDNQAGILAANKEDRAAASQHGLSGPMLDRLALDPDRVEAMAVGLEAIAALDDPVGSIIADWERPNGLRISRVRTPLGVIGVIYESRPNVTADAGALCLKAGNAAILRGGSESYNSVRAIHDCLVQGLREAGLPEAAIQLLPTRDRAAVGMLLAMPQYVDVIVPRGGKSLIERVQNEAKMPVFAHLEGICHIYVDGAADLEKALAITLNAKLRRTSICGAAECLLVDQAVAASHLPKLLDALIQAGCEVRGDEQVQTADARVVPAAANDWGREYLDAIIACKVVDGVGGAVAHIAEFGSSHTDSIITEDAAAAERFLNEVDSAIVMHNVSTQFGDGGEFGMGAEIGIATGRMHARGPIGVDQLTTFKYIVRGDGQIRP